METYEKISFQNIYKALCKFALSIVDNKYIKYFDETINWIRNDTDRDALPKIAVLSSYHFFDKHPNLLIYIRKYDNKELPFMIGEFHFTYLTYVFIVPFSIQDELSFDNEDSYSKFWECFHYKGVGKWSFNDFSNSEKRTLIFNAKKKKKKA